MRAVFRIDPVAEVNTRPWIGPEKAVQAAHSPYRFTSSLKTWVRLNQLLLYL